MKIVLLTDLFVDFPGGAERYVFNVVNQLRLRGHSIVVLTSYWKTAQPEGMKVSFRDIGVRSQSERRHEDGWAIIAADMKSMQPDVIITHAFFAYEFEQELAALGIPIIQTVYNNRRLDCAELAVYVSQHTKDEVGSKPQDMVIIPPAFDDVLVDGFYPLPYDRFFIGFIKPIRHKGIEFLYDLADAMPDRRFLVLRGEWNLIEDIRQKPNVEFMESVREMREFYALCRIMLMPSNYENAGTVAQEAAVNGIPCISSDVMGLNETNAVGIRLPLNVPQWVQAINGLDNQSRYGYVARAQQDGLKAFEWPIKFDKLSAVINEIAGK